jgi:ATP-dependent DNA ligase
MCKDPEGRYEEKRRVMLKVKHERTADCVVAGFRWHKDGEGIAVGSLLLGLYDGGGRLQHVGVAASFTQKKRRELVDQLAPLRMDDLAGHPWGSWAAGSAPSRGPAQSRWSAGKDLSWVPLRPERVVEVRYDHMQGRRFRHTTHVVRWRDDKPPADCGYEQLEVVTPAELQELFAPR